MITPESPSIGIRYEVSERTGLKYPCTICIHTTGEHTDRVYVWVNWAKPLDVAGNLELYVDNQMVEIHKLSETLTHGDYILGGTYAVGRAGPPCQCNPRSVEIMVIIQAGSDYAHDSTQLVHNSGGEPCGCPVQL